MVIKYKFFLLCISFFAKQQIKKKNSAICNIMAKTTGFEYTCVGKAGVLGCGRGWGPALCIVLL